MFKRICEQSSNRCDIQAIEDHVGPISDRRARRPWGVVPRVAFVAATVFGLGGAALVSTGGAAGATSAYVQAASAGRQAVVPMAAASSDQMQNAANWAIAEKNSPDPTWSDHFGHPWSGWCEQFVEQAEGFTFTFSSATANYQWAANNGRIHTDADPPVGALVFYASDSADGHVAISIGGGQAVGTVGYGGERLAVAQYPVVGFISNYLGWAAPIGS